MHNKTVIAGVGCSLVDNLYNNISFSSKLIKPFLSDKKGDGGLTPGHLVFKEDLERFSREKGLSGLRSIISNESPDKINIGGPGIVPMIHAAQLADKTISEFRFYGVRGNDDLGRFISSQLEKTTLLADQYKVTAGKTPSTIVLSDPDYNHGNGERIFINTIGTAWEYEAETLDQDFYNADIVVFGGTAVVPLIHNSLNDLLKKAKENGCITIVNTVYDFINEKLNSNAKWPLGKSDESYRYIDLLIMDCEEAIRLSGVSDIDIALKIFKNMGTGAVIITHGVKDIRLFSTGNLFREVNETKLPISSAVSKKIKEGNFGDTTGCGDNFVGGIISSLVSQIREGSSPYDLVEACIWGIISGGTTCFYMGGMFEEKYSGEKRDMILPYYEKYKKQIEK